MKLFFAALLLLACSLHVTGQTYHLFEYKSSYGVCDSNAQELVPPGRMWGTIVPDKHLLVLSGIIQQGPDLTIDDRSGRIDSFTHFFANAVTVLDETYSLVEKHGRHYLLSETTDKVLPLKEDLYGFETVSPRYITAICMEPDTPGKPAVRTNPYNPQDILVLANTDSLTVLLRLRFATCKAVYYKGDTANKSNGVAAIAGLLFSTGQHYVMYNSALKKAGAFVAPVIDWNADPQPALKMVRMLETKCSSILHRQVAFDYVPDFVDEPNAPKVADVDEAVIDVAPVDGSGHYPTHVAMDAVGDNKTNGPAKIMDLSEAPESQSVDTVAAVTPHQEAVLEYRDRDDGTLLLRIREADGSYTNLFNTPKGISLYTENATVNMSKDGSERVQFDVDLSRHKLLLPEKYVRAMRLVLP